MESQMISGKMFFYSSFFLKFIGLILLHATAESEVSFFIGFKWPKKIFLTPVSYKSQVAERFSRDYKAAKTTF